jgi:uncharacterized protein YjbI with pentapeptide repeats
MFVGAKATAADLSGAELEYSVWQRAVCRGARFQDAKLAYGEFSHADIRDADFTGAGVFRTRFHAVLDAGAVFTHRAVALGDDEELRKAERYQSKY